MSLARTGYARQRLSIAATLAADGHATVARHQLRRAEITLRSQYVGHADLARRLEDVLVGDVTTPAARREVAAVMRTLDSELRPMPRFRVASDGGERL